MWLMAGSSYPVLVVYTVILGLGYGGFIALSPAVLAERFGAAGLGGVLGTLYTAAGLGAFVSPPLAGWIVDQSSYTPAVIYAASCATAGFVTLLLILRVGTHRPVSMEPVPSSP
jgi:MFS family permease